MKILSLNRKSSNQQGSVIVSILIITLFLSILVSTLVVLANANLTRARQRVFNLQAQYAAESGADVAIAQLNSGNDTYTGSASHTTVLTSTKYKATFTVDVVNGATTKQRVITATGYVYVPASAATATYQRKIEVIVDRSSTETTSGMAARNIIYIDSGVKDIQARDIYVNGFIQMNKNTTNLIAENIFVADKNTGATNCSLGGTGNLVKPSSFSAPGQTKTNITLAYNNCITPPGNVSNADFNVLANQTTISKMASTYIPVSNYMDNSYQNSANNCNDWTTGTFPRTIPSTGNTKKTHYPDSASGISTSCGTSGNLALTTGQYNISDHVHIRANLCATSACSPTFYNPNNTPEGIKYVFIEGTVNFDSVQTAAGSGPIVFIIYGSDPVSKAVLCPYGGAFYLGNGGTTGAPALFVLTMNGLCMDKTRFGSSPALGGMSGKNLYIATNSGTPFDLKLDPLFPVDKIPIDLAWRAMRYRWL